MLVVDDEPSLRLLCRVNLELDGHHVREAGTVADARRELERVTAKIGAMPWPLSTTKAA